MIVVVAKHTTSGTSNLVMRGHVPEVLCAWFSGFTASLNALYGGEPMIGEGFYSGDIPEAAARKLLRSVRTVARKYPKYVVVSESTD